MAPTKQAISHEAAAELATRLRKQGIHYSQIAKELNSRGYVSPRTGAPIKEMAVRYMIVSEQAREKTAAKEELEDDRILLATGEKSLKENIETLLKLKEISNDLKLRLIESLLTTQGK